MKSFIKTDLFNNINNYNNNSNNNNNEYGSLLWCNVGITFARA